MRVINVVTITEGILNNIDSFGIFDDQLSQEVVDKAKALFIKKAKELGYNDDDDDDELIDNGYYMCNDMSVALSWSEI